MLKNEHEKGHSEEYFSEFRDHWWNNDFLELMSRRWGLAGYTSLLDVGCGEFHWGKLLARYLTSPEITGVDNDPKWSSKDVKEIQQDFPNAKKLMLVPGSADMLPFPDNSFDVVTCQTVLIHLSDPEKALSEMKRVVKPSGVVICAEPNNMAPLLSIASLDSIHQVAETLDDAKIYLYEQYGKFLDGKGYNSIGDLVPLFFQKAGLINIQTYLSDKCIPLIPPYNTKEQSDTINSIADWLETDTASYDATEIGAFVSKAEQVLGSLGIDIAENIKRNKRETKSNLESETLYSPGSTIMYLVSGNKV